MNRHTVFASMIALLLGFDFPATALHASPAKGCGLGFVRGGQDEVGGRQEALGGQCVHDHLNLTTTEVVARLKGD